MTKAMQRVTDKLTEWERTCGLTFNASKTIAVLFTRKRKVPLSMLKIDGHTVPYSDYVAYLGVELDCKLHWIGNMFKVNWIKQNDTS